jgi:hypothetical protein
MLKYNSWFFFILLLCGTNVYGQSSDLSKMTPEQRNAFIAKVRSASGADWQRMLDQLHIELPKLPAPEEDPNRPANLTRKKDAPNWYDEAEHNHVRSNWGSWSNYDEAKANNYKLPDPLVLKNGWSVASASTWWNQRRPEILNDYLSQIYGPIPAHTPAVQFAITATDSNAINAKAIQQTIRGTIDNARFPSLHPVIDLTLYLPVGETQPVPLMVIVWGAFPAPTATIDLLISNGWAVATFNTGALQADNGAGLTEGIIGLMNAGKPRGLNEWGVLSAWSWGLSRALDYFEKDANIHPKQICIQGHSRWGKTAMWAAALDTRWAMVFSSCSGSMGASLEKRNYGETIDNVAGANEYHWMTGNFLKYAGHWNQMPVDAHMLMALIAPRPLFITGGTRDSWADPKGEFLACVAASPVYALLGKKGVAASTMPAPDVSLIEGDLAFRMHEGGHTDAPDWPVFLQFAKRYMEQKQ